MSFDFFFLTVMNIVRLVLYLLVKLYRWTLLPVSDLVLVWLYERDSRVVPSVDNPLLLKSATTLAKMIRNHEVKSEEVVKAFIERTKIVNPIVNAMCQNRYDLALEEARKVDDLLSQSEIADSYSAKNAPFLGVPLSVKEAFALKGMPNSSGLKSRRNLIAEEDADVVHNLRKAGAIPYVVTNISELCMWYESANKVYGRSKNPYHTGRIVGGSSGGEGCLLGAGSSVIGIGSDIGGSIRMPSFFNGVFGHRTSKGIVSNVGQYPCAYGPRADFLSTGPMCRYAEDLLPMLEVMAGENAYKLELHTPVDLKTLKIFYMLDDGGSLMASPVKEDIKDAILKVKDYFKDTYQIEVKPVSLSKLKYSLEIWMAGLSADPSPGQEFCTYMSDDGNHSINPVVELVKWLFFLSDHTLPAIALGVTFLLFPLLLFLLLLLLRLLPSSHPPLS
ncbi:FAAH2 [Acanthosepion pharaonis]|uniref:FAAH2 n=1 Tax=Acanthosepion pharaonis TaxID=158019 RepID=A0A812D0J1_ACAPH|nr:FAAH2 [Sepia pharaonis]